MFDREHFDDEIDDTSVSNELHKTNDEHRSIVTLLNEGNDTAGSSTQSSRMMLTFQNKSDTTNSLYADHSISVNNVDLDDVAANNESMTEIAATYKEDRGDRLDIHAKGIEKINQSAEIMKEVSEKVVNNAKRSFSCKICDESFSTTAAHNKHLRTRICVIRENYSTPIGCYKCSHCSCSFIRPDYLNVHEIIHDESIPFNFDVEFVDLSSKISKVEEIANDGDFYCEICDNLFINRRLLLHHMIITHGKRYKCKTCSDVCESKNKCRLHMQSHGNQFGGNLSDVNLFHCKLCKKNFRCQANFDKHNLTIHTQGEVSSFPCDQCKKVFSSQSFLDDHKETVHLKNFPCSHEGCKRSFSSQSRLESHMLVHEERSFMCNVCGKMFTSKSSFLNHMNSHDTERRFGCDVCKKLFKTRDVLSKHKRIHSETRQFCCEICGRGFNQSGTLKKHMDSHNNVKRFECDVCKKKFAIKASLQNHKLLNNHFSADDQANDHLSKSMKCDYCDKLFPPGSMYMYKRHVVIHTGEKPYNCDICSKAFSDKSNLKYHKLIHSDNKPFSCSVCGRGFVQKRGLRKHRESSQGCNVPVTKLNTSKDLSNDNLGPVTLSFSQRPTELFDPPDQHRNMLVASTVQSDPAGGQVIPFQGTYDVQQYEADIAKPEGVISRQVISLPTFNFTDSGCS